MNEEKNDKGKKEEYTDSLEYLRAKYLKKGVVDYAKINAEQPQKHFEATAQTGSESSQPDDLQSLRNKYSKRNIPVFSREKLNLATVCNILLLSVVLITALCSLIWFAAPVTELGGKTYRGKTVNVFSFLFGSESSVYEQINAAIEIFKGEGTGSDNPVSSAMKLIRLLFLGLCGLYVMIDALIGVALALLRFANKNREKLVKTSVNSVIGKLKAYIVFVFFGNVSGGEGIDSYYFGYGIGTGMTVGVFLGLAGLIAVCVMTFLNKRGTATDEDKRQLARYAVAGVAYTAIAIAVALMRLYSVFIYSITSLLTAASGISSQGFDIKSLLFPALNLILFCACELIVKKVTAGFQISYERLLAFGERTVEDVKPKMLKQFRNVQLKGLIIIVIASAASCLAVIALNMPEIGLGWSVNFYPQLVAIFALSAIGVAVNAIIFKERKIKS